MRIRSRGLGRRELLMDVREFAIVREGDDVVLKGVTHAPITWETTVFIGPEDVGPVLRTMLKPAVLGLAVRWMVHPRRHAASREPEQAAAPAAAAAATTGWTRARASSVRREEPTIVAATASEPEVVG